MHTLCHLGDLADRHLVAASFEDATGRHEVLVGAVDGEVRAWFNECPHAGRSLDWAPGRFLRTPTDEVVCAAHGATFRIVDGICTGGPCVGQGLIAVPICVHDGVVWLDRG